MSIIQCPVLQFVRNCNIKKIKMKCFAVLLIVAIASVALANANPIDVESIEPTKTKDTVEADASVRDKRTLLLGAAPYVAAPIAYSAYTSPLAYSAYSAPYTSYPVSYSAYSAYPYYASSYYVV